MKAKDDSEPDKDLRAVEFMKSNYGPIAETIAVRWKAGVFVPEPKTGSFEKIAAEAKADAAFLDLLDRFNAQGRNVGVTPTSPNYAPTLFAKEATGFSKRQLEEAMRRLFNSNTIRAEPYGRPSNEHRRLARSSSAAAAASP
jgi:RecA-family ATPase